MSRVSRIRTGVKDQKLCPLFSRLSSDDESEDEGIYDVRKAHERLVHVSEEDTVYDVRKAYDRNERTVSESDSVKSA